MITFPSRPRGTESILVLTPEILRSKTSYYEEPNISDSMFTQYFTDSWRNGKSLSYHPAEELKRAHLFIPYGKWSQLI